MHSYDALIYVTTVCTFDVSYSSEKLKGVWNEVAMFKFNVLARHFYRRVEVNDENLQ